MSTEISVSEIPKPVIEIQEIAIKTRDDAIFRSKNVLTVTSGEEQKEAIEAMANLRSLAKRMESSRELVKRPVLDIGKAIDTLAKDFSNPITQEVNRLNVLVSTFQREEFDRAEKVKRKQEALRIQALEEEARKQADLEAQAQLAKTPAEKLEIYQQQETEAGKLHEVIKQTISTEIDSAPVRVAGMVVRKDWKFEVVDLKALHAARPELCLIEPNSAMIRGMIRGGVRECPGLRIYQDFNTGVRA